jgi:hypothetical protein
LAVAGDQDRQAALNRKPCQVIGDQRSMTLEHGPKKLLGFFDSDMLQLFESELRPYRSEDSLIDKRSRAAG